MEKCKRYVKFSHTRYRPLGSELIPVYKQSACRWLSHPPGGRLPLLSAMHAVTSVVFARWRHPYTVAHTRFQLTVLLVYRPGKDDRLSCWKMWSFSFRRHPTAGMSRYISICWASCILCDYSSRRRVFVGLQGRQQRTCLQFLVVRLVTTSPGLTWTVATSSRDSKYR